MSLRLSPAAAALLVLLTSAHVRPVGAEIGDPAEARPPNVMLILTDDQRADAVGAEGRFPFLETPHIDRLAAEGTSFERAFVTTSLCSPSRASILTGAYAHRHGVLSNDREDLFDSPLTTWPEALRAAGYETAFIGKWHMSERSDPRPGFDYWLSFSGQGVYFDPLLNEDGREVRESGYITDLLTDYAERWLERERDAPFALIVSHKASHHPFTPAPRHEKAFHAAFLPRPVSFDSDLEGKPAWLRHMAVYGDGVAPWSWRLASVPEQLPDTDFWIGNSDFYVDYLRSLLAVDDSVGRLLALLDARGELENTLVVFTSDNGFHLGEHRLTNKMLMYEQSIGVPLMIRAPGRVPAGAERDAIVTNLDIAPTILEAASVPVPDTVQGRSLWPLIDDARTPWRDALFYQHHGSPDIPVVLSQLGVRTERWKYICEATDDAPFEELYDLANDPEEVENLVSDPGSADALEAMRARLAQLRAETGYPDAPPVAGADESDWGWTLEYWKREVVYQWRALSRRVIQWLRPLKEWLVGSEDAPAGRFAMRGAGGRCG